jgi:hypothetical protein
VFKSRVSYFALLLITALSATALAACGGGDGGDEGSETPTATATSRPVSVTATTGAGGLGDLFANACDSISLAAGVPDGMIDADASDEPPSDFASDVADYFTPIISDALSGATAACFIEALEDGGYGLYIGYRLDEPAPANSLELLEAELISNSVAAEDIETFSASFGGAGYSYVSATNVEALGEYSDGEAVLLVSGQSVVLAVNSDGSGSSFDPTATPPVSGTSQAGGASASPTVVATGAAKDLDDVLRPELEQALGVSLNLVSELNINAGDTTSVALFYQANENISGDAEDAIGAAMTELGGTVVSTFSSDGTTLIYVEGIPVGNKAAAGQVVYNGEEVSFTGGIQ